ncbi:MAG: tRNA (N6-isopentenyl adenosine(37)-C2)-methylthiotransferase MiaB, partial [Francisellaceae bacterium]|nr:tRNA (N6-isopentenyl adenosine(37)-C2)-methylthiotransferase MiaB [Francisellaceae bacterium]
NTCSIREKAEQKVYSEVGSWRRLKEKNPNIIIGVAGCVASQEGENITKRAPYVDLVFGPQTLHRLPQMLEKLGKSGKPVIDTSFPEIEKFDHLPKPNANSASAYISIMEGCNKYCTYCIVPYTRGAEIHRPFDDILTEVVSLADQGVKEITLLGQNVNAYKGTLHDHSAADLATLITFIAEIDGIQRIRFTTSHPMEFSDSLINAYAQIPKLANHLHLPVQSGSDSILAKMKRGHTALEFKAKIKKLRQVRPDISITSDFIIGFPGESEQDFADTLKLIEDINFDHSFSFIYSQRPGTPATSFPDNISADVKKNRLKKLQNLLHAQASRHAQKMLHSKQKVLVTGISKKDTNELAGRCENNRVVNFKGDKSLIGQIAYIHITDIFSNRLHGELV